LADPEKFLVEVGEVVLEVGEGERVVVLTRERPGGKKA